MRRELVAASVIIGAAIVIAATTATLPGGWLGGTAISPGDITPSTASIYRMPEPNSSWTSHGETGRTALFTVQINGKGLREEPFDETPPPGTTRILVLGDSFTFGEGVNRSQRFTDLLEDRLNTDRNGTYQVIAAGVRGFGMLDHYVYLRERGLSYQPDLVVVAFSTGDVLSMEQLHRMQDRINRTLPADLSQGERSDRMRAVLSTATERWVAGMDPDRSPLVVYANRTMALARDAGVPIVFFAYQPLRDTPLANGMVRWMEQANVTFVHAPREEMRRLPSDEFAYPGDGHFRPLGHRLLADRLYAGLQPVLERDAAQP